jgi:hypothetical protein
MLFFNRWTIYLVYICSHRTRFIYQHMLSVLYGVYPKLQINHTNVKIYINEINKSFNNTKQYTLLLP